MVDTRFSNYPRICARAILCNVVKRKETRIAQCALRSLTFRTEFTNLETNDSNLSPRATLAIVEFPELYIRNRRFYTQLWCDAGNGKKTARRFPLKDGDNEPVGNLQEAREALDIKRNERRESKLPTRGHKPQLIDYCAIYFDKAKVQRKRSGTLAGERQALARWCDHIGHVRLDRILGDGFAPIFGDAVDVSKLV